jgi:hypothetical protein
MSHADCPDVMKLISSFIEMVKIYDPSFELAPIYANCWIEEAYDLLHKKNKKLVDIQEVMKFIVQNKYWRVRILSIMDLGENYSKIRMEMMASKELVIQRACEKDSLNKIKNNQYTPK